jgi:hypothetical protein
MLTKETEATRREHVFLELERILRANDRLPAEQRMSRLRELAAGNPPEAAPPPPKPAASSLVAQQLNQRRLRRLKLLSQQFLLSRNTCTVLQSFVVESLSARSKHVMSLSRSRGRLSPLQQIVWNVAPFFKHSERTDSRKAGHIAWEDVVRFLEIAQDGGPVTAKKKTIPKIVNLSSHLKNDAHRLRVIYKRIQEEAPEMGHTPRIMTLLARHTGNGAA